MTQTLRDKIAEKLLYIHLDGATDYDAEADAILSVIAESVPDLKWDISGVHHFASTEITGYSVSPSMINDGYRLITSGEGLTHHPTLKAAKAAAQADYTRRILSALGVEQ